jgi:hypothetical protein
LSSPIKINQYLILKVTYSLKYKHKLVNGLFFLFVSEITQQQEPTAAESTAIAVVSTATESTATAVVSATTSSRSFSFLQDTTVKTATTAKLKNTFSS